MDLSEYIKKILTGIGKGIVDADAELKTNGGYVVSKNLPEVSDSCISSSFESVGCNRVVSIIEFDIPLTIFNSGGMGVAVTLGKDHVLNTSNYSPSLSRIKFKIPLALPDYDK